MAKRDWTEKERSTLRAMYPDTPTKVIAKLLARTDSQVYQQAAKLGLAKSSAYMASPAAYRFRRDYHAGWEHRYKKGHSPANKGLRRPGWSPGRMRETQFTKGQEPHNTLPMWSFRWCDGYLMLKTGAPTPKPTTGWEYVHKLIWEQANGPIPDWRIARLWWKDGDHGNCSLANLELVTGAAHVKRTSMWTTLPPELARIIQLTGALKRKIRTRERRTA